MVLMVGGVKAATTVTYEGVIQQDINSAINAAVAANGGTIYVNSDTKATEVSLGYNGQGITKPITIELDGNTGVSLANDLTIKFGGSLTIKGEKGSYVYPQASKTIKLEAGAALKTEGSLVLGAKVNADGKIGNAQPSVTQLISATGNASVETSINIGAGTTVKGSWYGIKIADGTVKVDLAGDWNTRYSVVDIAGTTGNAIVNVGEGTYVSAENAFTINNSNAVVNITAGDITSNKAVVKADKGSVSVSGGTLTSETTEVLDIKSGAKFKISNGTLNGAYTVDGQKAVLKIADKNTVDKNANAISGGNFKGLIIDNKAIGDYTSEKAIAILLGEAATTEKDGYVVVGEGTSEDQAEEQNTPTAPASQETTGNTTDAKNPGTSDNFMSLVSLVSASAAGLFIAFIKAFFMVGGVKAADVCDLTKAPGTEGACNAEVNGQGYAKADDAFIAVVNNGGTYTQYLENVKVINNAYNIEKNVTLNTGDKGSINFKNTITVKNGATLTLNGNFELEKAIIVEKGGKLIVNGKVTSTKTNLVGTYGTVEISATAEISDTGYTPIIAYDNANVILNGEIRALTIASATGNANISVNGGEYTATNKAFILNGDSSLTINNGEIKSTSNVIEMKDNAKVKVADGKLVSSNYSGILVQGNSPKAALTIDGGTIISESRLDVAYAIALENAKAKYSFNGGMIETAGREDAAAISLSKDFFDAKTGNVIESQQGIITGGNYLNKIIALVTNKDGATIDVSTQLIKSGVKIETKDGYVVVGEGTSEEQAEEPTPIAPASQETTGNTADAKNPGTSDNFMSLVSLVSASAAGLFIAFIKAFFMVGGVKAEEVKSPDQCSTNKLYLNHGNGTYTCSDTFTNALNGLEEGETGEIVLQQDMTLAGQVNITKDVTINLNGHKLTGGTWNNNQHIYVKGANVTIKNGTLVFASGTGHLVVNSATKASTLTIANDVKVESTYGTASVITVEDATETTVVNINGNWTVNAEIVDCLQDKDDELTVNLNANISTESSHSLLTLNAGKSVVNVNGGSYTAKKTVFNVTNGTLNVKAGTITSAEESAVIVNTPSNAKYKNALSVAGGNLVAKGQNQYSLVFATTANADKGIYKITDGTFKSGLDSKKKQLPAIATTAWNFLEEHPAMITGGKFIGSIIGDVQVGTSKYTEAPTAASILVGDATVTENGQVVVGATNTDQTEEQPEKPTPTAPESQKATGNTTDAKNPGTSDNFMSLVSLVSASAAGLFIAFIKNFLYGRRR